MTDIEQNEYSVSLDVNAGDFIEVYEDIDMDQEMGMSASITLDGVVEEPDDSDMFAQVDGVAFSREGFNILLQDADGYQVTRAEHMQEEFEE
jgi:hypothetical protein